MRKELMQMDEINQALNNVKELDESKLWDIGGIQFTAKIIDQGQSGKILQVLFAGNPEPMTFHSFMYFLGYMDAKLG